MNAVVQELVEKVVLDNEKELPVVVESTEFLLQQSEVLEVVSVEDKDVVVVTKEESTYVSGGVQGPPGIPGSSEQYIYVTSAQTLGGSRAVTTNSLGLLVYPDMSVSTEKVLGVTTASVVGGVSTEVQITGILTEPSWNWDVNLPVYVGSNGVLTQQEPSTGVLLVIGYPVTPSKLFIDKQPAIIRT